MNQFVNQDEYKYDERYDSEGNLCFFGHILDEDSDEDYNKSTITGDPEVDSEPEVDREAKVAAAPSVGD